jgi:TIR domain
MQIGALHLVVCSLDARHEPHGTTCGALPQRTSRHAVRLASPVGEEPPIPKRIFISYRRADGEAQAITDHLRDRLLQIFGQNAVFKDVFSIPGAVDFRGALQSAIAETGIMLVIIGKNWLNASNKHGRRLDDPADPVRQEIESGIMRGLPILPLLIDGAPRREFALGRREDGLDQHPLAIGPGGEVGAQLRPDAVEVPRLFPALGGDDAGGTPNLADAGVVEFTGKLAVGQHAADRRQVALLLEQRAQGGPIVGRPTFGGLRQDELAGQIHHHDPRPI